MSYTKVQARNEIARRAANSVPGVKYQNAENEELRHATGKELSAKAGVTSTRRATRAVVAANAAPVAEGTFATRGGKLSTPVSRMKTTLTLAAMGKILPNPGKADPDATKHNTAYWTFYRNLPRDLDALNAITPENVAEMKQIALA